MLFTLCVKRKLAARCQLGHNCLRDFTGIDSPESVSRKFSYWAEIRHASEGYGKADFYKSIIEILELSAVAIRLYGWMARSAVIEGERCTSSQVALHWMANLNEYEKEIKKEMLEALNDSDRAEAQEVLNWVRSIEDKSGDYIYNLTIACKADTVYESKLVGIIVSAVSAYQREQNKLKARKAKLEEIKGSEFQGNVGDKLKGLTVRQDGSFMIQAAFGACCIYKFVDEKGNVYNWKSPMERKSVTAKRSRFPERSRRIKNGKELRKPS